MLALLLWTGCADRKRYHDEMKQPELPATDHALAGALAFQQAMNETFSDPETSPLPDRYRKDFKGLDFFEPDSLYQVRALFIRTPEAEPFMMPTTTERLSREVRYGIAHFSLMGKAYKLEVYKNLEAVPETEREASLFLPFLDNTNGETTYAGGRYLDLSIPDGDSLIIDFNKAYNPYCAYNKKYSCPIVPRVNYLDTEIRAGVKAFKGG